MSLLLLGLSRARYLSGLVIAHGVEEFAAAFATSFRALHLQVRSAEMESCPDACWTIVQPPARSCHRRVASPPGLTKELVIW